MAFLFSKFLRIQLIRNQCRYSTMELSSVVNALNTIAPVKLAEGWDNVGLLVEPTPPHIVKKILLTNDLTEDVLDEAIEGDVSMIISYHPPIFNPLKRITSKSWKERIVAKALENRIAVYSPHTACDNVQGGVNDWLASGLGKHSSLMPIKQTTENPGTSLLSFRPQSQAKMKDIPGCDASSTTVFLQEDAKNVLSIARNTLSLNEIHYSPSSAIAVPFTGAGRLCVLEEATSLKTLVQRVKNHLKLRHLRLALGRGRSLESGVQSVGILVGSWEANLFSGSQVDVYLSGEMSHHVVLDATQNGVSVILCEHSNTERGYLTVLKEKLKTILECEESAIITSSVDRDPLDIV